MKLEQEDLDTIDRLAVEQTHKYGHDRGHFTLDREDSSHTIGFVGEVGLLRFLKNEYRLSEPEDIGLFEMGDRYDVRILGKKVHVKTGRWKNWPKDSWAFGVHWDQKIEKSGAPVVLVSYLISDMSEIRIDGFVLPEDLEKCPLIKKGEFFPNMKYPSRCDNRLTYFSQYQDIGGLKAALRF